MPLTHGSFVNYAQTWRMEMKPNYLELITDYLYVDLPIESSTVYVLSSLRHFANCLGIL